MVKLNSEIPGRQHDREQTGMHPSVQEMTRLRDELGNIHEPPPGTVALSRRSPSGSPIELADSPMWAPVLRLEAAKRSTVSSVDVTVRCNRRICLLSATSCLERTLFRVWSLCASAC